MVKFDTFDLHLKGQFDERTSEPKVVRAVEKGGETSVESDDFCGVGVMIG
jgi:hypothetical protein